MWERGQDQNSVSDMLGMRLKQTVWQKQGHRNLKLEKRSRLQRALEVTGIQMIPKIVMLTTERGTKGASAD